MSDCDKPSAEDRKNSKITSKEVTNYFSDQNEELTLEDLAPDGGWGWMIALAMIIVFVTTFCAGASFAIVFGAFFEEKGQSGSAMTLLNSVFMISFSISGVVTNALLKKYSLRLVSVTAALLFAIPNIWSAFVTHVYELAVIFFIQGIGAGLMNTISSASFNAFFVKKRAKVMSAAQVIIGLGGIVYPMIIEKMMDIYGFRGTAAIIGALSLNAIAGMMMMHPVEWHLRDPNEVLEERRQLKGPQPQSEHNHSALNKVKILGSSDRRSTIHCTQDFMEPARWSSLCNIKDNPGCQEPLLFINSKTVEAISMDLDPDMRPRSKSISMKMQLARSLSLLPASSIGNITGALVEAQHRRDLTTKASLDELKELNTPIGDSINGHNKSDHHDENKNLVIKRKSIISQKEESDFWQQLSDLFELSLLKDRTFVIMSLGISFVFVSDFTFISLVPLAMMHDGYTNSQAAVTITVAAAAELASRILYLIFTLIVNCRAKFVFFFAMIVMGFAKLAFLYFGNTLMGIYICTAGIGIVRTFMMVPQPLVVVENYPVEMYAACYGIFTLVNGIVMVVIGPLVGIIKDVTNSFEVAQLVLVGLNCAFIVPWALEFLVDFRQKRRNRVVNTTGNINADNHVIA
ncbi:GSCOCG00003603001-RA-CDS [Cotesia congregata]|nr:GSCOCG00003603001-RA-CDS [Cotesia congregata]